MCTQGIKNKLFPPFRGAPCESVGPAKRRPAPGVTEEPSQNCHLIVSQQQRTEAAVSLSGQVRGQVYLQHACLIRTVAYLFHKSSLYDPDVMQSLCLSFRHVKVYNTTNYKVVHNFDYSASILSLALAVRNYIQPFYYVLLLIFHVRR